MPIYEFYCRRCNTIYSFLSRRIDTEKIPGCPHDKRHRLSRQVSRFAMTSGGGEGGDDEGLDDLPVDEARLESAMSELAAEAEGVDENDPKAAARLMRKLSQSTGMEYGETMQEALRRLEAGEDPDAIEAELGDAMEGEEDPFVLLGKGAKGSRRRPPKHDETLYDM